MNDILTRFKSVILSLEKQYGSMLVFALFLRDDPIERWDIVVSASWLSSSERDAYEIVVPKIQESLTSSELIQFSRVVILDDTDAAVAFLQEACSVTNGTFKEAPKDFSVDIFSEKFGFSIKKAYVLRCQKIKKT